MEMMPPDQEALPIRESGPSDGVMARLDRYVSVLTRILFAIAGIGLVGMLALIVADVIGIKVFSRPVRGGIEIVSFLSVVAIAFAVAQTQAMRGHVAVDFIVEKFPRRAKLVIDVVMLVFSVGLFAVLAWHSFKYGMKLRQTGEVSMTQKIPFYPFVYAMGVCFVVTCLVLVMDLVKAIQKAVRQWTR